MQSSFPSQSSSLAALGLRVALGAMWLSHSVVLKLFTFGLAGFSGWMASQGLPAVLALPIVLAEAIGGVLILVGFHGRWVSLGLLPVLAGATWIHAANGWVFTATGGGWEYPVFLMAASVVHFLLGDGELAVKPAVA
ncbi:MAG TPA: DoxX family protein [Noviherbaspirillum sp.]|jgi:putative oxidoreductase|uniref:DoxX family protein n=1 Tax=Noviherbaspirillum sp. TaxID=1926288 RepID=UPI002F91E9C8